jgi:hypothetical protein
MNDRVCACPSEDQLQLLAYDELPAAAGEPVRAHVDGCATCQRAVAEFRSLRERTRSVTGKAVTTDLWPDLLPRIVADDRARSRTRVSRRRYFVVLTPVAAAAALFVAIVLVRAGHSIPVSPHASDSTTSRAPAGPLSEQVLMLARPGIETLDRALAEVARAAAKAPDDPYLKRLLARTRSDRAAFTSQVSAMAAAAQ